MRVLIDKDKLFKLFEDNGKMKQFSSFFASFKFPNNHKFTNMSLQKIELICENINNQQYPKDGHTQSSEEQSSWKKGQYKLFVFVTAYYCFINEISFENLKKNEFDFLRSIFLTKSGQRMRYQIRNICSLNKKLRKKWDSDQILALRNIIEDYQAQNKKLEWKSISFNLFLESKGNYFKSYSQCREMWVNHLDLSICKEEWTKQEDYILLSEASKNKSWARITEKLGGNRSKHMVRNRYNSLVRAGIQKNKEISMDGSKSRDNIVLNQKMDSNVDLQVNQEQKIDDLPLIGMQTQKSTNTNQSISINQKIQHQNQAFNQFSLSPLYPLINEDELFNVKNYSKKQNQLNFMLQKPKLQIYNTSSIELFVGDFEKEEIILSSHVPPRNCFGLICKETHPLSLNFE